MWRLINTGFLSGPENMAIDEALLNCFNDKNLPILRLYGWEPAAISVGRFQNVSEALDVTMCQKSQLPVIRRITGGGLIYHHQELTYSIICHSKDLGGTSGLPESYKKICSFLLAFYTSLGLDADYAMNCKSGKLGVKESFCFAGNEQYDVVIQDQKIGGNAQRRLKKGIFQHGSIPVESQLEIAGPYLTKAPDNLMSSSTCLRSLGVENPFAEMTELLKMAFKTTFHTDVVEEPLSTEEQDEMRRLLNEKYLSDEWNLYSGRRNR